MQSLAQQIDRVLNDATVKLLKITSSPVAKLMYEYELRIGVPAYDLVKVGDYGSVLILTDVCAADDCHKRFIIDGKRKYCSERCCNRIAKRRHVVARKAVA